MKSSTKPLKISTTIPSKLCTHNSCIHIGEELRFNHDDNEKNQMGQEGHCSEQHQKNSTKRHHRRRFPIHHCGRFPLGLTHMSHPSAAPSPPPAIHQQNIVNEPSTCRPPAVLPSVQGFPRFSLCVLPGRRKRSVPPIQGGFSKTSKQLSQRAQDAERARRNRNRPR